MRLQNVVSLARGTLLSSPAVGEIDRIAADAANVRRGDLFAAYDPAQIALAVQNGAYGILFTGEQTPSDPEIAWIRVDDIDAALLRILRFWMLDNGIVAVGCSDKEIAVAEAWLHDARAAVLSQPLRHSLEALWRLPSEGYVFFPKTSAFAAYFVDTLVLQPCDVLPQPLERTLFETSFILEDGYFERVSVSPFFLDAVGSFARFCREHGLLYRVGSLHRISHFAPVFVDDGLVPAPYGSTPRVLIFEKTAALVAEEARYLGEHARWAKRIVLLPSADAKAVSSTLDVLPYDTKQDIIAHLDAVAFHFALIGGSEKALADSLAVRREPQTLF